MINDPILYIVLPIIIFFIWSIRARSATYKGAKGEKRVARRLHMLDSLDPHTYKVLNDVMLNTRRGSSQIDHVVVSTYGIFVIETKNYQGWIFGNEKAEYWTQTIYKKKSKFRNPIKQNWAHIYALKEKLAPFKGIKYHPIVAFAGSGELKRIESKVPVVYSRQLVRTIKQLSTTTCLSREQVDAIADRLIKEETIAPSVKEHKQQVRRTIHDYEVKRRTLVCPRCGADMALREGQYGKFYGCTNYPKCKYTMKYER